MLRLRFLRRVVAPVEVDDVRGLRERQAHSTRLAAGGPLGPAQLNPSALNLLMAVLVHRSLPNPG